MYTHSYLQPPLFFSLLLFLFLLDSRTSLCLSFSSFFFLNLILEHSLALCVIRNGERGRERKNNREILLAPPLIEGHRPAENRHSLCQAAPSTPLPLVFLPNVAQMGQMACVFFFFFFFAFIVMN